MRDILFSRRKSALRWVILLFIASALLRGLAQIDFTIATATAEPASPSSLVAASEGSEAMLEAFRAREERLVARETLLTERENAVSTAATIVEAQIEELAEAEASLAEMIALADRAASEDLSRLTSLYETMKPRDAAALFEAMDPAFAAGFIGMMAPAAGAAILSNLRPETAYSISVIVAGRNADTPTE